MEQRKFFYDDEGDIRGYWPVWHDWPDGEEGFNVNYWADEAPRCPICETPLRMTMPELEDKMLGIPITITRYLCEECQTKYYGPIRKEREVVTPPAEPVQEVVTLAKPLSIKDKYRYLVG